MTKENKILLIFIILFQSCLPERNNDTLISVSIPPMKYLVEKIAGEKYTVNILVPPGASPEIYEISPMQVSNLSRSRFFFITGHLSYELAIKTKLPKINEDIIIGDLSEGINLIRGGHHHEGDIHSGTDPHIWISPKTVKIMADNIFRILKNSDPEGEEYYRQGYNELLKEIDEADSILENLFVDLKNRSFLIFHPSLGYLARDYNLEQIPLEFEGKDPHPAYIQKIIGVAREKNIKTILIQKEFNIDNAKSLAAEINGKIIQIDPLAENWYKEILIIGNLLNEVFSKER